MKVRPSVNSHIRIFKCIFISSRHQHPSTSVVYEEIDADSTALRHIKT